MSDKVRVVFIDNPPVNGLGAAVRSYLMQELERALADANAKRSSFRVRARCSAPAPTSGSSERTAPRHALPS